MGVGPELEVNCGIVSAGHGNRLLLRTDGLHRSLTDAEVAGLLGSGPQEAADAFVAAALQAVTTGNVSVIVLAV